MPSDQKPGRAEADISEEAIKWLQGQFAKMELVPAPQEVRPAAPPITRHDLFMAATIAGLRANPKWDGSGNDEIRQISIMAKAQADDAVRECDEYSEEEIRRMMEASDPTAWRPAPSPNPLSNSGGPYPRNHGGDPDWS